MSIRTAIKKALASVQIAVVPHENPAPAEGTTVALVVPAPPPTEADNMRANATEAGRIIRQLATAPIQDVYKLDGETRRRIIASLNRYGPPKNAFQENKDTGKLSTLEGVPLNKAPEYKAETPVRVVDTETDKVGAIDITPALPRPVPGMPQKVTGSRRENRRIGYLEHKHRPK
jgi:hypothetical protein